MFVLDVLSLRLLPPKVQRLPYSFYRFLLSWLYATRCKNFYYYLEQFLLHLLVAYSEILMSTQEIAKAVQNLEAKTIQQALASYGTKTDATEKSALVEAYQNAVLETGLKNFVGKLSDKDIKAAGKAIGLDEIEKKKEGKKTLEEALLTSGINGLLNKADDKLLNTFCETLGLGISERSAMIKEIADEGEFIHYYFFI